MRMLRLQSTWIVWKYASKRRIDAPYSKSPGGLSYLQNYGRDVL